MRSLFGLVGVLMMIAMIRWLVKTRLIGRAAPLRVPAGAISPDASPLPSGSPRASQQQYRKALQNAIPAREAQDP